MKSFETHSTPPFADRETWSFFVDMTRFLAVLTALWLGFYVVWQALPHVRAGHIQIYDDKLAAIDGGELFPPHSPSTRVVVFGNSQVQSGFIPDLFDELGQGLLYSYNLGLPGTSSFVEELERLTRHGRPPTHVLLTLRWPRKAGTPWHEYMRDDNRIVNELFPFRHLFRDLAQFYVRSRGAGGLVQYYTYMSTIVDKARDDRGYYFIENQSHFEGHRLPDDFHIESETPNVIHDRGLARRGPGFEKLLALAERAKFKILIVPEYYREGQYAPSVERPGERAALARHGITVLGPDYWLYPNRLFSDPVHVNREGARVYTRAVYELVATYLETAGERHAARTSEVSPAEPASSTTPRPNNETVRGAGRHAL